MKRNVRKYYSTLLSVSAVFLLSACSSDDNNGNDQPYASLPSNPLQITSSNLKEVVTDTMNSRNEVNSSSDQDTASPVQTNSKRSYTLEQFARSLAKKPDNQVRSYAVNSAVSTINETIDCSMLSPEGGGTMTLAGQFGDNDSFNGTFSFNQCHFYDIKLDGSMNLAESCTTSSCEGTIRSALFSIEEQEQSYVLSNLLVEFTDSRLSPFEYMEDFSYELESTRLEGGVLVETSDTLIYDVSSFYPSFGQVLISGAQGSQARVTAIDNTQFRLELDETGSGTFIEDANSPAPWSEFDIGIF